MAGHCAWCGGAGRNRPVIDLPRSVLRRRVKAAGLRLSLKRVREELDGIREVANGYPQRGRRRREQRQSVLTKLSEPQEQLMAILGLRKEERAGSGYGEISLNPLQHNHFQMSPCIRRRLGLIDHMGTAQRPARGSAEASLHTRCPPAGGSVPTGGLQSCLQPSSR